MGPSIFEAMKRGEMQREIERLKESVDYHRVLLTSMQERLAFFEKPRVQEVTAADAYRKSIRIVQSYRDDVYTRNIQNLNAKEWVLCTIEGIVRELQDRLERCGGK